MTDSRPIFITARFRTGSTLLWNLFRNVSLFRAYYEPLHPGLLAHLEHTQAGHDGVDSYWDEYWPMVSWLQKAHRENFGTGRLLLEADDEYPELEQYIRGLIQQSGDRIPVLQFNRVDFRLPWLRRKFPEARLLHLRRNPRDVWISMMRSLPPEEWDEPRMHDCYDQLLWSLALAADLPFLSSNNIRSSYEQHYYLWRLSGLMGERQADRTLDFDVELQSDPEVAIDELAMFVPEIAPHREQLRAMIKKKQPGMWRKFRTEEWFAEIEHSCEEQLGRLGLLEAFGRSSLREIEMQFATVWDAVRQVPNDHAVQRFLQMSTTGVNHLLRISAWNTRWHRDKDGFEVNRRNQASHIQFLESQIAGLQAQTAALNETIERCRRRVAIAEAEANVWRRYGRTAQRAARWTHQIVTGLKLPFAGRSHCQPVENMAPEA